MNILVYPGVVLAGQAYNWRIQNAAPNADYAYQVFSEGSGIANNGIGSVGIDGTATITAIPLALGVYEVQIYFPDTKEAYIIPVQSIANMEFIWRPDAQANSARKPSVNSIQFGDGYAQTYPSGLNNIKHEWALNFTNLSDIECMQIDLFLTQMKGATPFLWKDAQGRKLRYLCADWGVNFGGEDSNSINAQFIQTFL